MSDNGHKEEKVRRKKCPHNGEWCIKDACELWTELTQSMGGMVRKMGMCSHVADTVILLEINKTLAQQGQKATPKLVIPGMMQG